MTTYVLVHGAWGGSWSWDYVAEKLRAQGHDVRTPTLTGMADRSHLLTPDVNLSIHIADVARLIEWDDLTDVVLAGHSYGGMVVAGVCGHIPERISQAVYIDAFVPDPGQSCIDILPWLDEVYTGLASASGGLYMDPLDPEGVGVVDPASLALIRERSTPMPIACVREPLPGPDRPRDGLPVTYVNCTKLGLFADTAGAGRERGWKVVDLDSDHFPSITHPAAVAKELLEGLRLRS